MISAGTLDSSKPVEKPYSDGAGDVENHLADFYLYFAVRCSCCHRLLCSYPKNRISRNSKTLQFLDRHSTLCYQILSHVDESNRRTRDEKLKSI